MKSIIQSEKKCFITGRTDNLQEHHIFFGAKNRENSERYGLKVWLTAEHHTGKHSPHRDREIDLYLVTPFMGVWIEIYFDCPVDD